MQNNKPLISIVIPCYNEEEVIEETIKRMLALCSELTDVRVELIFVDDGSHDNTREILKRHASKNTLIRLYVSREILDIKLL